MYRLLLFIIPIMLLGCSSVETKSSSPTVSNLTLVPSMNQNLTLILAKFGCDSGKKYKIKYKKHSSNSWIDGNWTTCNSTGNMNYQIAPLVCSTEYDVKVRRKWRTTWYSKSTTTLLCDTSAQDTFRLRHKQTGKCVYGFTDSPTNWRVFNWSCWNDPKMAFKMINIGSNQFKIQHVLSGLCLRVLSPADGGEMTFRGCNGSITNGILDAPVLFSKILLGNNEVRLKHISTNDCMYGTNLNGGKVHHWGCWNDPNMTFVLDSL